MSKILLILFICTGIFAKANVTTSKFSTDTTKKRDTLNIMISETNHIYYYDEPLQSDASNLITTVEWGLPHIIIFHSQESKKKGKQLMILLKLQNESTLNESSRKAIGHVKKENYQQVQLKEVEKALIKITEQQ